MHANAFGLSLNIDGVNDFIEKSDKALVAMETDPIYYVDYIFTENTIDPSVILEIDLQGKDLWGQDVDEPLIAIENLKVSNSQVNIYKKNGNTIKISLPCGVSLMKFKATDEEVNLFTDNELINITIIGKCNANEWGGTVTPQLFIEDYQINHVCKYDF